MNSIAGLTIKTVRQTVTVRSGDIEVCGLLQLPLNAPVLLVDRFVVDDTDRIVLWVHGVYRGDVVRFDMKLR
jgi:GntR family transcriptional regulator